jgi:glycosyltransferase-like protein LARGE
MAVTWIKLTIFFIVWTFVLSWFVRCPPEIVPAGYHKIQYEYKAMYQKNELLHSNINYLRDLLVKFRSESNSTQEGEVFPSVPACEVVHVVMVVAGISAARDSYPMIKSILFYRSRPVHFHFVSDSNASSILRVLFDTWQLPQVQASFYDLEQYKASVEWIPNIHYSGIFGLMKLLLTEILPPEIDKAIVLDTDLTFAADITELWQHFTAMRRKNKVLGIVENLSDWYLGKLWTKHKPWPALGRGLNTGVMLQDLKAMRDMNWKSVWKSVAVETLPKYGSTALADQDVINSVVKQLPHIHYMLPCAWNIQLGDHSLSEGCYRDSGSVKVLHWNSPLKIKVAQKHAHIFRNQFITFQEYNGELLRKDLLGCPECKDCSQDGHHSETDSDVCAKMKAFSSSQYRTHLYFMDYSYQTSGDSDVTLISHLSIDRLHLLELLSKHWTGPMSLSVYCTDMDTALLVQHFKESTVLSLRQNIALHVVYKKGPFYPVNLLRNVALRHVNTPFVFLSDIDLIPSYGSYDAIKAVLSDTMRNQDKKALIVPAFESFQYKVSYPTTKTDLLKKYQQGKIVPFRVREWPKGHSPTNFDRWFREKESYKVNWTADFEPYVVVRSSVHVYDLRFIGFGWNKVSHIMEMDAEGYQFIVLPNVFMVHLPHAPSLDIAQFRSSEVYRKCVLELKVDFINEISKGHNSTKYFLSYPDVQRT